MRVRWRARALADLRSIRIWLSGIEDAQPRRAIRRIRAATDLLVRLGDIGWPSRVEGLRELSVRDAPYVVVYRVTTDHYEVLAVYHTRQER